MKQSFLFLLGFSAAFWGCRPVESTYQGDINHDPKNNATLSDRLHENEWNKPIYRETEPIRTDLIHTRLYVRFDWDKTQLIGSAELTAKPHFYPTNELVLDAKGMDILRVSMDGKDLAFGYDSSFLTISLGKTYTKEERYTVKIDYVAKPEEIVTSGSMAITSDKGLYFINPKGEIPSKMPHIWTQGETEASSVWFPTIDAPNVKTTQEVFITVDNKYQTLSNGALVSSKNNPDGTRTDYWKQDLPHAPYLFMMGIGAFKVVKDTYTKKDGSKMEVNYYVEPAWEPHARAIFGETPDMIRFFSEKLGVEYPWDKYSQIVVRDYVSGAMENTGAVIFGDYVYKTPRELLDENDQRVIAHELFHHWFGDLVTCESWSNLPLNESFANYSEYLWDEHRYGLDQADYNAINEAEGYFQEAQMHMHDLICFDYADKEDMFDAHSYNKGGRILHMLRHYLGDDAFFTGLRNYLEANRFKTVEVHQLRLAFEDVCGEDLNWFFNQWFLSSGHPVLNVEHQQLSANQVTLQVEQQQSIEDAPIYKLPVDVAVYDDSGKTVHRVVVDQLFNRFDFPVRGSLKNIVFDDTQMLLAIVREKKPEQMYIHQYYHCSRYKSRLEAITGSSTVSEKEGGKLVIDALKDPFWDIRLAALQRIGRIDEEYRKEALVKINEMAVRDANSKVRLLACQLHAQQLDKTKAVAFLEDRIQHDSSYVVVAGALKQLSKLDVNEALKMGRTLEKEPSAPILLALCRMYENYGDSTEVNFFQYTLKSGVLTGFDQVRALNSFIEYISRQPVSFQLHHISIFSDLKETGGDYTLMFLGESISYLIELLNEELKEINDQIQLYEKKKALEEINKLKLNQRKIEDCKRAYENLLN
jgi:aminopeptidase N